MNFGTNVGNLTGKIQFVGGENPLRVSLFFNPFTLNCRLHNAFSMGVLKHYSGVICGPIIAVHSSNDVRWRL